jgi:hypothetical protein
MSYETIAYHDVPQKVRTRAYSGKFSRGKRNGKRGRYVYVDDVYVNNKYVSHHFVFVPLRKEGWMRNALRRTTLFMVCAALVALAVAVAFGGENAVVIAQILAACEIVIVAALVFFVAVGD